jgi:type IV pilus assembly protein PilN
MIRINLLGTPKPKKGKRGGIAVPVAIPSEGPSLLLVGLVVLLIFGALNYAYYWKIGKDHEKLQTQLKAADQQIATLSQVKTAYLEKQKQHDALKHRFDVIDQLRANQSGPVTLLSTISNTVGNTEAVWLNTMRDEGNSVTLEGVALSNVSLANLMENLKKTDYFQSVEMKETFQDDSVIKDIQSFSFTLVCEKKKA